MAERKISYVFIFLNVPVNRSSSPPSRRTRFLTASDELRAPLDAKRFHAVSDRGRCVCQDKVVLFSGKAIGKITNDFVVKKSFFV